jgi:hypothetical protein
MYIIRRPSKNALHALHTPENRAMQCNRATKVNIRLTRSIIPAGLSFMGRI